MFCCDLQSIARFIKTRPTSTRIGCRLKENVPETFKSQEERNKNVIQRARSVFIRRNCALGLSVALALWPREVLKTSGTVSPNTDLPAGE